MNSSNYVVFMDRDGVINEDHGYVYKPEDFKFCLGVPWAIRKLNRLKIPIIVVTNQSGVERGLYTEDDVVKLHEHMMDLLFGYSAKIDAIYYCPNLDSEYRKPKPGMLFQAIEDFGLEKHKKFIIGDKLTDMQAGEKAGCTRILVRTGCGLDEYNKIETPEEMPDYIASTLMDAVLYIERLMKNDLF